MTTTVLHPDNNELAQEELLSRGWAALPASYRMPAVAPTLEEARAWCKHLAESHYENFHVASWFLPKALHAAVPAGNDEEKEHVVLRPDFETAPDEKAFAVDAPFDPPLLHQQAAHQEAAEDEEDVHAGRSEVLHMEQTQRVAQQPIRGIVVIQHQQNGDAAQEIQLNLAPERLSRLLGAHVASIGNTPLRSPRLPVSRAPAVT